MKWSQPVIYLVILVFLTGYYYYFEVVKHERQEAQERLARRIFHFKADDVRAVTVQSRDWKSVRLAKDRIWKIIEPIPCQADQAVVEGLLNTVATLALEREVTSVPGDLKSYGLSDPVLQLEIVEKAQSWQLLLGDKNPTGEGYYAKIGDRDPVFLIAEGVWGVLHKGVDELRRREVLVFEPEKTVGLEVAWQNGEPVSISRQADLTWKAEKRPDIKIKSSKVQNVLEQLRWLRAQKFVEDQVKNLATHGLDPPQATVQLQFLDGKSSRLQLGDVDTEENVLTALSSELPAVVTIDAAMLQDLPTTVAALEDRSLMTLKAGEVSEVRWHLGDRRGRVIKTGENSWGTMAGDDAEPRRLKDSWQMSSLIYDLTQAEYLQKLDPAPAAPLEPYGGLDFYAAGEKLASVNWSRDLQPSAKSGVVWIQQGDQPAEAVEVEPELLDRVQEDLVNLSEGEAK